MLQLKAEVAALRASLRLQRVLWDLKAGFNPNQPRVSAGNPDGGQWTAVGASGSTPRSDAPTDFGAQSRRKASGHHYIPRSLYEKLPLSPEARKVFEDAKTGRLYDIRSNRYDTEHRSYNEAVGEMYNDFVLKNSIHPELMTAEQAQAFLREVLISDDPRIRRYNMTIQMREIMQRVFRRPGRPE